MARITHTDTTVGNDISLDDLDDLLADTETVEDDAESLEALDELDEITADESEEIEDGSMIADSATIAEGDSAQIAEVEALAAEAETDPEAAAESIEAAMGDLDDLADIDRELKVEAIKAEAYAEQDEVVEAADLDVETETETKKEPKAAKPKKEPKEKAPAKPRMSRSASDLPGEAFILEPKDLPDDATPGDLEIVKKEVLALRPSQVKIAEKFDNILCAIHAGRAPSVYTMVAFGLLDEKGEVSSLEIVAKMQKEGYSIGTARSQTGQMMTLFDTLRIAKRSGNKLTLNPDSLLAIKLREVKAEAAEPETLLEETVEEEEVAAE